MVIYKTEDSEGFWDKLQKGARPNFLKVDFAKWRDEDDEDEDAQADPMAGMGGPQGAGGMPDMSSLMGGGGAGGMDFSQLLNSADFNNMVRNRRGWKGYLGGIGDSHPYLSSPKAIPRPMKKKKKKKCKLLPLVSADDRRGGIGGRRELWLLIHVFVP
jgi:hypothetical protein